VGGGRRSLLSMIKDVALLLWRRQTYLHAKLYYSVQEKYEKGGDVHPEHLRVTGVTHRV
jgi:hypothetical protein